MGRLLILAGAAVVLAACSGDYGSNPPEPAVVTMPGFSFSPFTTTVRVGETVTYEFPAEPHNVIFADVTGAPADIATTSNRGVTRTFLLDGTFPYDCTLHPGMSGEVVVTP